jgi:hypothetical protein
MRRTVASLSITAAVLLAAGAAILGTGIGPASAFTPGEGTGKSWCATYGGTALGSYRDVYACRPDRKTAGRTPFDTVDGFQPTELANRFLYTATGHTLFDNDVAGDFVARASSMFGIPSVAATASSALPGAGDIVSMWGGRSKQKETGDRTQVAIVTAVASTTWGWTITTLNQSDPSDTRGADGFNSITVSANRKTWNAEDGFYSDFAWLRLGPAGGGGTPAPAPTPSPTSTSTGSSRWQADQAPSAGGAQVGQLQAVACAAAASCTAVGTSDNSALLVTRSGSTWTPVKVPLPASTADGSGLTAVTCPSASQCVAAGSYRGSGLEQGLLLAGYGRNWTATTAPLPAGGAAKPDAVMTSVACATGSSCVAVGQYVAGKSDQGLLVTGYGSAWSPQQAPLPLDAGAQPAAQLGSVSCSSATACTAVGSYVDKLGNRQGLLVTLRGGRWTAARSPLPADATVPGAELSAVECPRLTECVAVGTYSAGSAGLIVTGTGTTWTAAAAQLPPGAGPAPAASFPDIACSGATCVAVGSYTDATGNRQGMLVSVRGTITAQTAPLPTGSAPAQGIPGAELTSVACPTPAGCVAVGVYTDTTGEARLMLVTGAASAWKASEAPVPANARIVGSQAQGVLAPPAFAFVSCADASACVAVGSYPARKLGIAGLIVTGQV